MTKIDLQRVIDLDTQATPGPWEHVESTLTREQHYVLVEGLGPVVGDTEPEDAALIAHYRDAAPAMAAALKAVLDLHVMYWDGSRQEYVCRACQHFARWPSNTCPTVQPIYEHLGEQ